MNQKIIRKLVMFQCVSRFLSEHPVAIPRAIAAHAEIVAGIVNLEAAVESQIGGRARAAGGVDLREVRAASLREFLKGINRTARTLEEEIPGITAQFRLPKSGSYPALIASAQAILAAAERIQNALIECGLAEDFLAEGAALIEEFQLATAQKHAGRIHQVAATARLHARAASAMAAAIKLDAYVRNHFRHDPELLAAWRHARHIQRGPVGRIEAQAIPTPATLDRSIDVPQQLVTTISLSERPNSPRNTCSSAGASADQMKDRSEYSSPDSA